MKKSISTPGGGVGGGRGNPLVFFHEGSLVSLNEFYAGGMHWKRKKIKDTYHEIFTSIIKKNPNLPKKPFESFEVEVRYHRRFDVDNVTGTIKLFMDSLTKNNVIKNDSPKHWKKLTIIYDEKLPKSSIQIKVDWKS